MSEGEREEWRGEREKVEGEGGGWERRLLGRRGKGRGEGRVGKGEVDGQGGVVKDREG